jgi:hypothetical protein
LETHSSFQVTAATLDILSEAAPETPRQKPQAKPFLNLWPTQTETINVHYFKERKKPGAGGSFL